MKLNYLVDLVALISFLLTSISGVTLSQSSKGHGAGASLFLGIGRHNWTELHTLAGMVMIVALLIHLFLHWQWIFNMTKNILPTAKKNAEK